MKCLFCDTETTGLDPQDSAPIQIAFIYTNTYPREENKALLKKENVFYLNPLNETILYGEEAGKVHGYSKEQVENFPKPQETLPKVIAWIKECINDFNNSDDKTLPFFIGYNCKFDYNHLKKLFSDYGYNFDELIQPKLIDVLEQVKEAGYKRVLPYLPNRKLTTIAKSLNIPMDNAHDAICDISATREVAIKLQKSGINLFK